MKKFWKYINGSPLLAFLLALGVSGTFMAVKEYQRVSKFTSQEPLWSPSGLYLGGDLGSGGDGGVLDPTLATDNRLATSVGLTFTADAGKFSAVTGTTCNTIGRVTVPGAHPGDPCFAGFRPNAATGAPLGYFSTAVTCEVTAQDVVHARYCVIGAPIPDGGNSGQTPVGGKLQIRVFSNNL